MAWFQRKRKTPTKTPTRVEPAAPASRPRAVTQDRFHTELADLFANAQARMESQLSHARNMVPVFDSAENGSTAGIKGAYGRNQPNISDGILGFFLSQGFIGHQMCGLLAQNWLIDKACTMPARDAVRNWLDVVSVDGESLDTDDVIKLVKRYDKRFKIKGNCLQFIRKGRIFGVRVAFFKVLSTDPDYYEKPFNPDGIEPGSYKGIVQVDPYWMAPELDAEAAANPASMHFYEPTYWNINGKRYHRSHLIIFRNSDPVDILKPAYLYGGVPVPQKIVERVYAAERMGNEGPLLALSKRTTVIKMDTSKVAAKPAAMMDRLLAWVKYRDNYGVKVLDTQDEMEQFDTTLTDLDNVTMNSYQLVAAAANVPATKLLGTTPKGFNATGDYESRSYHEELESIQENDLTPLVERHHQLVMLAYVVPAMRRKDPSFKALDISHNWLPVDAPTAKEQAEINKLKAETGQVLVNSGAIDSYDERERLITDRASDYSSIPEVERPEEVVGGEPTPTLQPQAPAMDMRDGVGLWTNQKYINPAIVEAKRMARDYTVQVSPVFTDPDSGLRFRIVIDGHHSLAAANADGVPAQLVEGSYTASDYMRVTDNVY